MDDKIRKAYRDIDISEEAQDRIFDKITEQADREEKRRWSGSLSPAWKAVAACCLIFVVGVPVMAKAGGEVVRALGGSKILQVLGITADETGSEVDMTFKKASDQKEEMHYVRISADFGKDYTSESSKKDAMQSICHKDGEEAGKDFWYELIYLDQDEKTVLSTFDNASSQTFQINGNQAVYGMKNGIVGSRYEKDDDTDYAQSVYIFDEADGYLIRIGAQKKMGKKNLLDLVSRIRIERADSEKEASPYVNYSKMDRTGWEVQDQSAGKEQKLSTDRFHSIDESCAVHGTKFRVMDVSVRDSLTSEERTYLAKDVKQKKLFDKNGKLKSYIREKVTYGDGVHTPEQKVTGTERVQPKFVFVTAQVETTSPDEAYCIPALYRITKKDGNVYTRDCGYVRPDYIADAYTDRMPCYFRESLGGSSFWFTDMSEGKKVIHFAYLIDGDMTDGMALNVDSWTASDDGIFIDISRK